MQVTDIKVYIANEDKLKAFITVTLDSCFVVRDIKVIQGDDGLFVAMPSKRMKDGKFRDIAHPLNQATRNHLEKCILDAYVIALQKQSTDSEEPGSDET